MLSKIFAGQFNEITRPEVLTEIALILVPISVSGMIAYRAFHQSAQSWKKKRFFNLVNVSLNTITKNTSGLDKNGTIIPKYNLYFRTLVETKIENVITNEHGRNALIKAAKTTTEEDPFIILKNFDAHWLICNKICNHISMLSAQSFIHRDVMLTAQNRHNEYSKKVLKNKNDLDMAAAKSYGWCDDVEIETVIQEKKEEEEENMMQVSSVEFVDSVECAEYIMCLTREPERSRMTAKIRVMLLAKDTIEQILNEIESTHGVAIENIKDEDWTANLEDAAHGYRWCLVKKILTKYKFQERNEKTGTIKWAKPLCSLELCTKR